MSRVQFLATLANLCTTSHNLNPSKQRNGYILPESTLTKIRKYLGYETHHIDCTNLNETIRTCPSIDDGVVGYVRSISTKLRRCPKSCLLRHKCSGYFARESRVRIEKI